MRITTNISNTAVVGSGYMGGGIAQVLALHGYRVTLGDKDEETAETARIRLVEQGVEFERQGLLPSGAAEKIKGNLSAAASIEEAVQGVDYIAEAVPENPALKTGVLRRISNAAPKTAIIGTNTSALPIHELAQAVTGPERFLGVHWMNPAPFVPAVEIIPAEQTSLATVLIVEELMRALGKTPVAVADTPGFVANRLQFALYKEAAQLVAEGVATPSQVDAVVCNSFGFRLALFGPFAIGDMAGLDVYEAAYQTLERSYGSRFAAPEALAAVVAEGNLGIKTGRGFLDIPDSEKQALLDYRDNAYAKLSQLRNEIGLAPGL